MKTKKQGKREKPEFEDIIVLRLYVAAETPKSLAAIANLKKISSDHFQSRCKIEVVDLLKNPKLARDHQIVAIPTLVRFLPQPISKIIGDLSNTEQVLVGLDLRRSKAKAKS